jgi:hypothetical protein
VVGQKIKGTVQESSFIADSRPSVSSAAKPTAAKKETQSITIEGLVTSLRSAGATVQITSQSTSVNRESSDWKKEEVLIVNGYDVQIFEYKDDEAAADAVAKRTVLDSISEYRANVTTSRSHIYRAANVVAQYLGDDSAIINLLESVLGKEISVAAMSSNKDVEAEAMRLTKEMEEKERNEQEQT